MKTINALRSLEAPTSSQYGLITSAQAVRLGIDRTTLSRLTSSGDLISIRRGVYSLPSNIDPHQHIRAAWLASAPHFFADERAGSADFPVLSHSSAAYVHGIGNIIPYKYTFTTNARKQTRHSDIRYVQRKLTSDELVTFDGMTLTSSSRTIGDLASAHTDGGHLADIVRDTLDKSLATVKEISTALAPFAAAYGQSDGFSLLSELLRIAGPPASTTELIRALPLETIQKAIQAALEQDKDAEWEYAFPQHAKEFADYPKELYSLQNSLIVAGNCLNCILSKDRNSGKWNHAKAKWEG